ncbi:SLC13 family permease [Ilumatobacter sp.]|uniref:SLC13 family permease n=1 Tax=Ilumatobacter sp. TaxID=1967498 RepID=UPI0037537E86|nr:SLC13 family permease [Ilumatobacter sp.]
MTLDAWIALVVILSCVVVLIVDRLAPVVVLGGAVVSLMFANVIDSEIALSGLASPAPATIGALYILAGAVTATGTFSRVFDRLLDRNGSIVMLAAVTAAASSVVPNTPLVAMFAPRVVRWSQLNGVSASRFLLPLSFASVLGGVITLIGTSTNLVVSDLLSRSGEEPLGVLEITVVGLPVAVVGVGVLSTIGMRLLPERAAALSDVDRRGREFQLAARVTAGGPIAGRTIAESGLRNLDGAFLALVERPDLERRSTTSLAASPHTRLEVGDVCCFVGDVARMIDLHDIEGLTMLEEQHVTAAQGPDARVFEAVVAPGSVLVGGSLKSVGFRASYGAAVMAIHRADGDVGGQLGQVTLRAGDVLLVLADESFASRWRGHADFSLVAALEEQPPARRDRSTLVILATAGLVVAAVTGFLDLFEAALASAIVVVAGRAISLGQAWRSININVVATMAAAISLGAAVSESGLAAEIAGAVERANGLGLGDAGHVIMVMLATIALTELLTNTAAAALMVPISLSIAADANVEPRMLTVAVLIGASCSFLSPVGYQTNLMVFGLGGYRFTDFTRVGAPLTLTTLLISTAMIPWAFD